MMYEEQYSRNFHATNNADQINILEYWRAIKKWWRSIVVIVLVSSVVAVIASLLMKEVFKAEALIIPINDQKGGMLSALAQMSGGSSLLGLLPGASSGGGQSTKIMAVLKSRTLSENVINRMNLMPILYKNKWDAENGTWKTKDPKKIPTMEKAVKAMQKKFTKFNYSKKEGTIKLEGFFPDRQLVADVLNTYLDELQKFINKNTLTVSKKNRIFIEEQLESNKKDLLEAGKSITRFYRENQVSSASPNLDVDIDNDSVEVSPTKDLSDYAVLQNTVNELTEKKEEIEKKLSDAASSKENGVVTNVPQQVYLQYLTLRQQLLGRLNALLSQQYEIAKIEEAKEDLSFQVIDKAVPPVKRFKPKRSHICMATFFASILLGVFYALSRDHIERMKAMHRQQQLVDVTIAPQPVTVT